MIGDFPVSCPLAKVEQLFPDLFQPNAFERGLHLARDFVRGVANRYDEMNLDGTRRKVDN